MSPPRFPLRAAAALFIERQHLDRPRGRRLTATSLERFVSDVGGLQLDSINVIERAHYLTAWSRFGPYDKTALDRLAYRRRLLFEYWAHAACLVSTRDYASWRRVMIDYHFRTRGWQNWLKKNRKMIVTVEAAIARDGPLGSSYFEHRRKPGDRGGWWNWKPAAHALDYLWMTGRTLVHSRPHFQKRYHLSEHVMPEAVALEPPSAEEFRRWHVRRSLHAMGAATETDLRMYLTYPRMGPGERRRALRELIDAGEVVEVAIDADGRGKAPRWLALAEDLPALERAARRRAPARGTTLLSPFDSFLWHRDRTRRLFGFEYTIEVYVPGPKRVHGYYVLPIFHDGRLVGRADLKTHRAERRLEAKRVHFEPWFAAAGRAPAADWGELDRDAALAGVAGALRSLATFVGADRVTLGTVEPRRLAAPLKRALKEMVAPPPETAAATEEPEPATP